MSLDFQFRRYVSERCGALHQLLDLLLGEDLLDDVRDAALADNTRHAEEDVVGDAVLALRHRAQRVHLALVLHDAVAQRAHHAADRPARVALQLDDLVGAADHLGVQLTPLLGVVGVARLRVEITEARARHVGRAPHGDARVAVLADDVAVAAGGGQPELLAHQEAEARRVEHRAAADDALAR